MEGSGRCHRADGLEDPLHGVVQLGRGLVEATGDEDPALEQQRGGVTGPRTQERPGRGGGAQPGVVDLGRGDRVALHVLTPDDQHSTVEQRGRGVAGPRRGELPGRAEGPAPRVVGLDPKHDDAFGPNAALIAADDQHAAVLEQRGRMALPRGPKRPRGPERVRPGVVHLRRRQEIAVLLRRPADDQHAAVLEQRGRMAGPPGSHRVGRGERVGPRVVQLGR